MAVEKDKVLPVLETKLKGKGYTKAFKEQMAEKLGAKIEKEEDIETYIDDRLELLLEADKDADRRVTEAVKKAAEKPKEEQKKEESKKDEIDLPDDTPTWAKTVLEGFTSLKNEVNTFKQAQTQQTIAEKFKTDPRVKDIPEFMFKGRIPSTEDEFETAVTELATDYETFTTQHNVTRFGKDNPGASGQRQQQGGKAKEATKEEIDAVVGRM